ncbi:MAG TPA: hypothetical protein VMZ06_03825, partial [Candidatus Bathyarchaeia archaeon]|nr:hypothetical protein [Candidatus Bathyarchaeia archaeon]
MRNTMYVNVASTALMAATLLALLLPSPILAQSSIPREDTWITDRGVYAIATTPTTTYIGGQFHYIGPITGAGVPIDTTTGQPAGAFPHVNDTISACFSDGFGGWYIGGGFTQVGNMPRNHIAHILANGTVDLAWNPNADNGVTALAVSGTTVYAGGQFTSIGGQPRNGIAALDATTGLATPWNPAPDRPVSEIAVSGTTVYVSGGFEYIGGQPRQFLAALDATTGLATDWDPNPDSGASTLVVSGDGTTVYAGGSFANIGGQPRNFLAAIDAATGLATNWNPDANNIVSTLVVSGTTVYAGGVFTNIGRQPRNYIAAIDAVRGLATGWNPDASGSFPLVRALAMSQDGTTVYAAGDFNNIGGQERNYIAAIDIATGLATDWSPNASSAVCALAVSGTTVYAGGFFKSVGGVIRNGIAALDAATGQATDWNPDAGGIMSFVDALAISDTTIYAAGPFTSMGGQPRNRIAAIDAATGQVTDWNPGADKSVEALAVSDDGATVYAGGNFTNVGGQPRN